MTTKLCHGCDTEKPVEQFFRSKRLRDGRSYYCKGCSSQAHKRYVKKHAVRVARYAHERYLAKRKEIADRERRRWQNFTPEQKQRSLRMAREAYALRRQYLPWHLAKGRKPAPGQKRALSAWQIMRSQEYQHAYYLRHRDKKLAAARARRSSRHTILCNK